MLAAAGVSVDSHDLVAPDLGSSIGNGGTIVVRRGHLLHLTVNGKASDVWVNADSVDEALAQLGYNSEPLVSVSRSMRLDTLARGAATSLSLAPPKRVVIQVDRRTVTVTSAARTVGDALGSAMVVPGPGRPAVGPAGQPGARQPGDQGAAGPLRLQRRLGAGGLPRGSPAADSSSYVGQSSLVTSGRPGVKRVTYRLTYLDGKLAGKVPVRTKLVSAPVDQLTRVGTQQQPVIRTAKPAPVSASRRADPRPPAPS